MTPTQFVLWLRGYIDALENQYYDSDLSNSIKGVRDKLAEVQEENTPCQCNTKSKDILHD